MKRRGVIKDFRSSFPPPSPGSPRALPTQPAPCSQHRDKAFLPCLPSSSWLLSGIQVGPWSLKAIPAPVCVPWGCPCPAPLPATPSARCNAPFRPSRTSPLPPAWPCSPLPAGCEGMLCQPAGCVSLHLHLDNHKREPREASEKL